MRPGDTNVVTVDIGHGQTMFSFRYVHYTIICRATFENLLPPHSKFGTAAYPVYCRRAANLMPPRTRFAAAEQQI